MAFHSLADDKVGYRLMYKVWSKNSAIFSRKLFISRRGEIYDDSPSKQL